MLQMVEQFQNCTVVRNSLRNIFMHRPLQPLKFFSFSPTSKKSVHSFDSEFLDLALEQGS